ncbi:uncharacterized protein LOC119078142 [Bradysia coprophila]|uniref:uncharacterized protein LOC119078142 n=1 Tax=Bradysia coprophila TaxID=38358 RepID=UPI00187D8AAF|nr:uncharacterized protein LOC119078142 [Bradysia coprophila]
MVNITTNYLHHYKRSNHSDKLLLLMVNRTEKYLREHQDIAVINADKGNKTIILNRNEYDASMENLVNDNKTYVKTTRNPTSRIETRVNDLISEWRLNNKISDEQEKYLKSHNSVAPAVYGLGKLHKKKPNENIPLRPVVATIQSPTYKLSKLIAETLGKVTNDSPFHVKDSWQFAKDVKEAKIPVGYKLISLDATSLYTNVPAALCTRAIKKRWQKIKPHSFLTQKQFLEAVNIITTESYFRYKDHYYLQISGLAMGNSISGFLADMVMDDLEVTSLSKLPFNVPFYRRHVDDIIVAVPENGVDTILQQFNKYHKNLKFTIEEEIDASINFLDMSLHRQQDGHIVTTWYQKAIASGRYLHFKAHNPISHKRNVASALTDRAIALTNPNDRPKSLKRVKDLLSGNGYPDKFVSNVIKNRVDKFYNNTKTKKDQNNRFIAAPYIPGLSEKLKKSLNQHNLTLSCKTTNRIGNIYSKTKYTVPKEEKSKVIYQVKCRDCNAIYIGITKQKLKDRMSKHRSDVHLKKTTNTTGLTLHAVNESHTFNFNDVKILEQIPNYFQRIIAEKMFIHKASNTVNTQVDKSGLHASYINLMKLHNSTSTQHQQQPTPTNTAHDN